MFASRCVLELRFANHAVSIPETETTLEIKIGRGRTIVQATGSLFHLLDITEQLCWLTSACRISSYNAWSDCAPLITEEPWLKTITIDVTMVGFPPPPATESDSCWIPVIGAANIVNGFPIRRRPNNEPGLELSLDALFAFAGHFRVNSFDSKLVIKSYSTLFVAMQQTQSSTTWHGIVKEDLKRVSFRDTDGLCPQMGLDMACLKSDRHFLGWSINTTQAVGMSLRVISIFVVIRTDSDKGTRGACYTGIMPPKKAEPRRGIKFALSNLTLSGGMFVNAGASVALSHRQAEIVARREAPLEWKVHELTKINVLLYDDSTRRGWLIDGASAALHLLRLRLAAPPYNTSTLFDIRDFCYADDPGGPEKSRAALIRNRNHRLYEMRNEYDEVTDSSRDARATVTYWKGEHVIVDIWNLFEQMVDHQVKVRAANSVELHATFRDHLEGWPLRDLAEGRSRLQAAAVKLHGSGRGWADFVNDIRAITLLGGRFGDIIRPSEEATLRCPHWQQVPPDNDYLTVRLQLLRQIDTVEDDPDARAVKLSPHAYWHKAHRLFEECDCAHVDGKECDRVQVLLPRVTIGAKRHPGSEILSSKQYEQAAVIFGRSRRWRWRWRSKGDPKFEDGPSDNESDSGISMGSEFSDTKSSQGKSSSFWRSRL